jgi:KUP system potassium uptake protein
MTPPALLDNFQHNRVVHQHVVLLTNVPALMVQCSLPGYFLEHTTFFVVRETVLATRRPGMALWRERLFAFLSRNAQPATAFFGIPPDLVIEIGNQIEI